MASTHTHVHSSAPSPLMCTVAQMHKKALGRVHNGNEMLFYGATTATNEYLQQHKHTLAAV